MVYNFICIGSTLHVLFSDGETTKKNINNIYPNSKFILSCTIENAKNSVSDIKNKPEYKYYEVLDTNMPRNREIFRQYQREANMGKKVKDMDKQIMTVFVRHIKKPFDQITKDDVVNFFDALESGEITSKLGKPYAPYTIEFFKSQLNKFFKWFTGSKAPEQTSWLHTNVRRAYKHKTRADILTLEEVQTLIDTADNSRNKAIIAVLYDSAARVGEFAELTIKDIVEDNGETSICVDGKTGQRIIPLNFSVKYLKEYLSTHSKKNSLSAPLWLGRTGKRLGVFGVQNMVNILAEKSGIQKTVSPHILRHTRLTELAKVGMNESQMRYFAGWSNDSTMPSVYLHINGSDVRETLRKIEPHQKLYTEEEVKKRVESRLKKLEDAVLKISQQVNANVNQLYKDAMKVRPRFKSTFTTKNGKTITSYSYL